MKRIVAAAAVLIALAVAAPAAAQNADPVASFQAWRVYSYSGTAGRVCYLASRAQTRSPDGINRDPEYFMVANWPERATVNEISTIMGYPLEPNSTVTVTIDNRESFEFFVLGDAAWIRELALEQAMIAAMRRGITMEVRGRSRTGIETVDTYSLRGVTAALERAAQECR